jgi:hypothetical protein
LSSILGLPVFEISANNLSKYLLVILLLVWSVRVADNGYVLAMVGHLKNVSSTFVQMPNRSKSVEFTTVSHTIANTMLAAVLFF